MCGASGTFTGEGQEKEYIKVKGRSSLGGGVHGVSRVAFYVFPTQVAARISLGQSSLRGGGGADKVDTVKPTRPSTVTLTCPGSFVQL